MMRKPLFFGALLALLVLPWSAGAQRATGMRTCVEFPALIVAQTMASSRSFEIERPAGSAQPGLMTLYISLTDANTSITRLDMSCTASHDNNTTDYTLQTCAISSGACTSTDASWRKASPGSVNWVWRVDVEGYEDTECTFSVGTGAGAAADLLSVKGRLCGK